MSIHISYVFLLNDTATTEIYTLSLHDALPISFAPTLRSSISRIGVTSAAVPVKNASSAVYRSIRDRSRDRKSTRLNSSHVKISYAVFCLKKKTESLSPGYH